MKKHAFLLLLAGLGSLVIAGQLRADSDTPKVRRVHLQATGSPLALIVAAEAVEGVGGSGTDLSELAEGDFCTTIFDQVRINESGDTVVLIGKNINAADAFDYGAYVKITAHTDGRVNFVFQALNPNGHRTGATGLDLTGTVKIEQLLP